MLDGHKEFDVREVSSCYVERVYRRKVEANASERAVRGKLDGIYRAEERGDRESQSGREPKATDPYSRDRV